MREKLLWGVFVVVAACAVAAAIGLWLRRGGSGLPRVPDFELVERSGKRLMRRDLLGQVWVADFFFTQCQGVCPAMISRMHRLQGRVPEARYVSFTSDPENDTPAALARFAAAYLADVPPDRWLFVTGPRPAVRDLSEKGFHLPMETRDAHRPDFVLVDRYSRIRGAYNSNEPEAMKRLEEDLARVLRAPYVPVQKLPAVNAALNATSAVLLIVGLCFIKAKRVGAHKACMLAALAASTLFLAGYLTAHYYLGSTPYPGRGVMRPLYFTILTSHTALAALIVPLVSITLYRAFREQFDRHRAIARWTLPLWLYVSVTGVGVYFMLYG